MASTITVNMGTVKSKADELKNLNSSFRKQVEELKSKEASLNSMWEGEARKAFHNAFNNDAAQMNKFYDAIEKYINSLNEIVKQYQQAENKNLSTAQQRKYK